MNKYEVTYTSSCDSSWGSLTTTSISVRDAVDEETAGEEVKELFSGAKIISIRYLGEIR